ncbi:serine/threonine-protein kinase, partial [Planctomycetota bacterium]
SGRPPATTILPPVPEPRGHFFVPPPPGVAPAVRAAAPPTIAFSVDALVSELEDEPEQTAPPSGTPAMRIPAPPTIAFAVGGALSDLDAQPDRQSSREPQAPLTGSSQGAAPDHNAPPARPVAAPTVAFSVQDLDLGFDMDELCAASASSSGPVSSEAEQGQAAARKDPAFRLGGYAIDNIDAPLGSGSLGMVYRARRERDNVPAALKIFHFELIQDPSARARLLRAGETLRSLHHPSMARYLDFGDVDGVCYVASELLEGDPLSRALHNRRPTATHLVAQLFGPLLEALSLAHSRGVLHLDLKPQNVLVTAGDQVRLLDTGLVPPLSGIGHGRGNGPSGEGVSPGFIAAAAYASPEQVRGDPVDLRADLYAVAVMLFEALAGRLPFASDTVDGFFAQHLADEPPPLSRFRQDLSSCPAIESLLRCGLSKDPAHRFPNAESMRMVLLTALQGTGA